MFYTIYQTTNKINGKFYIGKHKTKNLEDGYIGSGLLLWLAINKYGIENFEKKILFFLDSEDEMNLKEKEIVNEDFVAREDTYNLKVGGDGGWDYINDPKRSGYDKEKRSIAGKTWTKNPEMVKQLKEKLRYFLDNETKKHKQLRIEKQKLTLKRKIESGEVLPSFLGKHHTEETKRKIREKNSIIQKGKNNSNYNHHWWKDPNDKTKSLSIKEGDSVPEGWIRGKWITEEQRRKNSQIAKGRVWYFNPTTKESKQGKFSLEEEQQLLSNGWLKGHRNPDHTRHLSIRTYTNDGKTRLKIKEGEPIPEGYVLLYTWNKEHPKKKKTPEELKESFERSRKLAAVALQKNHKQWIENNLSLWKEMYLWYLEHNEDFEALCTKYKYTKGKTNFQHLIRKYLPEIYKFDTRKYSKPRPKIRGPYKKHKKISV